MISSDVTDISTASDEASADVEETREIPEDGDQDTQATKFQSILNTKPRGKTKMQVDKYEQRCQKQLDQLNKKMNAINNKKDAEWLKLRKRKIACEARLRSRRSEATRTVQLPMLDQVLMEALSLAQAVIAPNQLADLKADLKKRLPSLM